MICNRRPGYDPLGGLRGWGQGQISTFSEHGHVAYQITCKWNHGCSNMVANILPNDPYPHPPPTHSYQIKGKHAYSSMVANSFQQTPTLPPPDPGGSTIGQKSTFSEHVHVAYQIKWNHKGSNMVVNILSADLTARPWGGVKIQLLQNMVMLHIKLNGIMDAVTW